MKKVNLVFQLNGREVAVKVPPETLLVDLLREVLGLKGTKIGCREGECGACTVLLDGDPVNSCILPALKVGGRSVVTIEGLSGRRRIAGPAPAGLYRSRGGPVRFLHPRYDSERQGAVGQEPQAR